MFAYHLNLNTSDKRAILIAGIGFFIVLLFFYFIPIIRIYHNRIKRKNEYLNRLREAEIKKERIDFVLQNSIKIKKVERLNHIYSFYAIPLYDTIDRECNSKREYERFDLQDYFLEYIREHREYYHSFIEKVEHNKASYEQYKEEYTTLINDDSADEQKLYNDYVFFKEIENQLCNEKKKNPTIDPSIIVRKSYTSPGRRSYYEDELCFEFYEIKDCYALTKKIKDNIVAPQYERSLMSDSLRYDILKRDGFRCVLCGATAKDGAKLHVDHIYPVSKGGKTEPDNLRTLCESCNRGKGAKYDYNGVN